MKKLTTDFWVYLFIVLFMLGVAIGSLQMTYYESKLLPLIISGSCIVLAGAGLIKEIRTRGKPSKSDSVFKGYGFLIEGAWVAGFVVVSYLVGFLISIPVFIFTYSLVHRIKWITGLISAIGTVGIMYGAFELGFEVVLYRGLLFQD